MCADKYYRGNLSAILCDLLISYCLSLAFFFDFAWIRDIWFLFFRTKLKKQNFAHNFLIKFERSIDKFNFMC